MEIIKTRGKGRPSNYSGSPGSLYLTIRDSRGTMTDDTASFLGLLEGGHVQLFIDNNKVYISKPEFGDNLSKYKKVSRINGRFGIFTKHIVGTGMVKPGIYELLPKEVRIDGRVNVYYELKLKK